MFSFLFFLQQTGNVGARARVLSNRKTDLQNVSARKESVRRSGEGFMKGLKQRGQIIYTLAAGAQPYLVRLMVIALDEKPSLWKNIKICGIFVKCLYVRDHGWMSECVCMLG